MTWFIFFGDMAVMAFLIGLAIWFTYRGNSAEIAHIARIPLDDDEGGTPEAKAPANGGNDA